jgi:hypothetical protein
MRSVLSILIVCCGFLSGATLAQSGGGFSSLPACPKAQSVLWNDCIGGAPIGSEARYFGEWRRGVPAGQGEGRFPSGERYTGTWRDGAPDGRGVYVFPSGARYVGDFFAGRRNGEGVQYWAGGGVAHSGGSVHQLSGRWVNDRLVASYGLSTSRFPFDMGNGLSASIRQTEQALVLAESQQRVRVNERRVALVIGNAAYTKVARLDNPVNDAEDMARSLIDVGFEVYRYSNLNRPQMDEALRRFEAAAVGSSVTLVYYAGHGSEYAGSNFMIPVDYDLGSNLAEKAFPVKAVLDVFERSSQKRRDRINILILDACRDPAPKARTMQVFSRATGLAKIDDAPSGTFVAFSTAPGGIALDGVGQRNSPYTRSLVASLQIPDLSIEDVFKETRKRVFEETRGGQQPWEQTSLTGRFVFRPLR